MSFKIEFLARARKEFFDAWDWYEDRSVGLGDRFKHEIDKTLQQIEKMPERYSERKKGFREAKIDIFPYCIIFRLQKRKKMIAISSIFHTRRDPKKKYSN